MTYIPAPTRYDKGDFYRRCGNSGLKLSQLALGYWHNFGDNFAYEQSRALTLKAFDLGITHFDLANNYGPPAGTAEMNFGRTLVEDLAAHRDEMIITTKAGYDMWPGPYGNFGSRKYLLASLDQSLDRMGLEYVDIFYHHRPDPETPLEETMGALADAVHSGKALYVALSNYYNGELAERAIDLLADLGTPCLIHQHRYHLLDREAEKTLMPVLVKKRVGGIAFCPLAQGLLTDRYLAGISADSRAARDPRFLKAGDITEAKLGKIKALNEHARERGQSLAQMALAWTMKGRGTDFALIGASKVSQIEDNVAATQNMIFTDCELAKIDAIVAG